MSVIIRLQNLPLTANSIDIRSFFRGLSIPDGGVHIVGGKDGDAFIAFSSDEDARQAMALTGSSLQDSPVKLLLSSRTEMFKVIEQARQKTLGIPPSSTSSTQSIPSNANLNSSVANNNNNNHDSAPNASTTDPNSLQMPPGGFPGMNMPMPFGNLNLLNHQPPAQQQQHQQMGLQFGAHALPQQMNALMPGGNTMFPNSLAPPNSMQPQQQQIRGQAPSAANLNPFLFPQAAHLNLNAFNLPSNQMNPNLMQAMGAGAGQNPLQSLLGQPPNLFKNAGKPPDKDLSGQFGNQRGMGKQRDIMNDRNQQNLHQGFRNMTNGPPAGAGAGRARSRFDQLDEDRDSRERGFREREGNFRGGRGGGGRGAGGSFRGNALGPRQFPERERGVGGREREVDPFASNVNNNGFTAKDRPDRLRRSRSRSRDRRRRRSLSKSRGENKEREIRRHRSRSRSRERTGSRDEARGGRIGNKRRDSSKERDRNNSPMKNSGNRSESDDCLIIDTSATDRRDEDEGRESRPSRFDSGQEGEREGPRASKLSRFDSSAPEENEGRHDRERRRERSRFEENENGGGGVRDRQGRDRERSRFDESRSSRFDQEDDSGFNRRDRGDQDSRPPRETKSLFDLNVTPTIESSTIIMHSVPPHASEVDVSEFFGDIGLTPIRVKILFDATGTKTGSVICEFNDPNRALRATTKDGMSFGRNKVGIKLIADKGTRPPRGATSARGGGRGGMRGGFGLGAGGPRFPAPSIGDSDNPFVQALQAVDGSGGPRHRLRNPVSRGGGLRMRPGAGVRPSLPTHLTGSPEMNEESQDLGYFERPGCVVAVSNVPYAASMDDISKYLEENLQFPVNRDRIIRRFNENKRPTGDARIAFDTPEEAKFANDILQNTQLWNRNIQVTIPRQF